MTVENSSTVFLTLGNIGVDTDIAGLTRYHTEKLDLSKFQNLGQYGGQNRFCFNFLVIYFPYNIVMPIPVNLPYNSAMSIQVRPPDKKASIRLHMCCQL